MRFNDRSRSLFTNLKSHWAFLAFGGLAAVLFLTDIGAYKKFLRAESYFSLGSRMVSETHEFLLPHSPQELPLNKPPVQYWLIGLSYHFGGVSYATSRIPSALCALAVIAVVYVLGFRLYGKMAALTAVTMLASSHLFLSFARLAMPDMTLTLCVSVALCCWLFVLTDRSPRPHTLALVGYAAVALGFLVKGPVAVVLAAAPVLFVSPIARGDVSLKQLRPVQGLVVFLLIAAPYFFLVYLRAGIEPLRTFFVEENLKRFAGNGIYHARTSTFEYPFTVLGVFAPWSLLTILVAYLDIRHRRKTKDVRDTRALRILYLWVILPAVFFSISRFRLDYYLLPVLPAMALITARIVSECHPSSLLSSRIISIFAVVLAMILLVAAGFSYSVIDPLVPDVRPRCLLICFTVIAHVPVFICLWRGSVRYVLSAVACAMCGALLSVFLIALPSLSQFQPVSQFARNIAPDSNVYVSAAAYAWAPDLAFRLPTSQPVNWLSGDVTINQLKDILQADPHAVALVYEREYSVLQEGGLSLRVLAQGTVYQGRLTPKSLLRPTFDKMLLVTRQ